MVAPAKRQLPVGVSKSVRDPNGGAVALRDLSAIDAPNQYLAQDHARSEIRSQASYSDAGSSVSPASSIARSAASSSLGKRPRAVAPSANPASKPSFFTPADDQSLRDLVAEHGAEGDCDWGKIARSLREGKWDSRQCRERCPRPPVARPPAPRRSLRPCLSTAAPLRSTVGVAPSAPCPRPPPSPECARRWNNHLAPGHDKKGGWSEYEDAVLFGIVEGIHSQIPDLEQIPWSKISEWFKGRTPAWLKCPQRMLSSSGVPLGCPSSTLARSTSSRGSLGTGSALRHCGAHTPESRALAALRCRSLAAAKLLCRPRVADFAAFDAWPRLRQHGQE